MLLSGGPGTGKSIFSWQYIYNGAKNYGEPGIYVATEERPEDIRRNMLDFGMDIKALEEEKMIAIIDAATPKSGVPSKEEYVEPEPFKIEQLMYRVYSISKIINAKRLALDSLPALGLKLSEEAFLDGLHKLNALLLEIDCTTILTTKKIIQDIESKYSMAEYIVQGSVVMDMQEKNNEFIRSIAVMKMRGTEHSLKRYPLEITSKGIVIKPGVEIY